MTRSPRRTMCASVLTIEGIVLGLSTIVLITVEGVSRGLAFGVGLGMALAALIIAGLLGAELAYYAGFALQVAAVALGFVVTVMFVLGLIFGGLYTTAYVLGRKIEAQQLGASEG